LTRSFFAVVALALIAAGCGGGSSGSGAQSPPKATGSPTTTVPSYLSYFATVKSSVTNVAIFDSPSATSPKLTLPNPWLVDPTVPDSKVPQVFLVQTQRNDGWVQVLLPVRPNGSTGWLHTADVTLTANPYRIVIALRAHRITVTNGTAVSYAGPVAVGASNPPLPDAGKPTPTPTGKYYLRVLLQAPDPNTVYGPYAYGLSSHSNALDDFQGGDAEIGIHGNNDKSVLGKDATHGCVRMDNAAITALAKQLPLGTPVTIVA
jgi:lipoprotein-anchoring transpeptidase ErfK/SrfK